MCNAGWHRSSSILMSLCLKTACQKHLRLLVCCILSTLSENLFLIILGIPSLFLTHYCKLLLLDILGAVQASSAAAVSVDADNAGTSGEVGRLQGQCLYCYAFSIIKVFCFYSTQGLAYRLAVTSPQFAWPHATAPCFLVTQCCL